MRRSLILFSLLSIFGGVVRAQVAIKTVASNAICVRPSAATAFGATLTGFLAP